MIRVVLRWRGDESPVREADVCMKLSPNEGSGVLAVEWCGRTDEQGETLLGPVDGHSTVKSVLVEHLTAYSQQFHNVKLEGTARDVQEVTLFIAPGATVSGRVIYTDGVPAQGVRVAAWSEASGDPESRNVRFADADGEFILTGVPPAGKIAVYPRAGSDDVVQALAGPAEPLLMCSLGASGPASVRVGELMVPYPRRYRCKVVCAEGKPVAGALVSHGHLKGPVHGWDAIPVNEEGMVELLCARPDEMWFADVWYEDGRGRKRHRRFQFDPSDADPVVLVV
jgi:hypothetical protein